ncbi:HugZ family protein [Roseibium sp. TrichSKD4]|uniref:HugZ family pyridoxamine 5'-phosphate oxidase n=1 Tax=Roseibium sp. TrichSKD4 TaxID=744980 RepID=UPI00058C3BEB|nr:DUF2470 domain-containing protein [Roseibium sp. TrichSKD4]
MTEAPVGSDNNKNVLREVDDDARRQAKTLVRTARYAALGALEVETGHPQVSRVALATDVDGTPVILTSTLSGHTSAIMSDHRCSLLCGEPGKGDPLAHPRISLFCRAERIDRKSDDHGRLRRRYLARHPKAELYVDFGDFAFFRLDVERAGLNGGFGKAYELHAGDVILPKDLSLDFMEIEESAVAHMNEDHADAVRLYAEVLAKAPAGNWRLTGLDPEGGDLGAGDETARFWFIDVLQSPNDLRKALAMLAKTARNHNSADNN